MSNKIILVTNMPTPYRLPLWDALIKISNFKVICISKIEKNRQWNLEERGYISFLKSYHLFLSKRDWGIHISFPLTLFFTLIRENPDAVIIGGYDSIQAWEALFYTKLFRKKSIFGSGTTLLSGRSKNKIINKLKKYFVTQFDSYYTYGTEATKYIESFGIGNNNIVTGINTVDTDYYKKNTSNKSSSDGIVRFLYVGQLIERKGLKNTILAFSKIKQKNWKLRIVGSGHYEVFLKKLVAEYNLIEHISFEGFKQKEEIVKYYSDADVFLMPSYLEVWGLVLNEALGSGLFCLSSKYAGATFDLIKDGKNGYVIDPKSIDDIVEKIERVLNEELNKQAIKNDFTVSFEKEAIKFAQAINLALKS